MMSAPWHDASFCATLLQRLNAILDDAPLSFMEVCGTHTTSIFQSGLRSLLPDNITHLSGPGCPVCVTHDREVALFLELAKMPEVIIATFGDLLRVPGPNGLSLKHVQSKGANIQIVYSPLDALKIAQKYPEKEIVFLGVGFETTAPAVAATILSAQNANIHNFSVLSMHKLVAPALRQLINNDNSRIDAFLLPGHVATITGLEPFNFLIEEYNCPAAIGGFEPADILLALCDLADQVVNKKPQLANCYPRAVAGNGNRQARKIVDQVFTPCDTLWRGLGKISLSGLRIQDEFSKFDSMEKFGLVFPDVPPLPGCQCGAILQGIKQPPECALFGIKCTPANPAGPCMVSTEGSCAAFYKYGVN